MVGLFSQQAALKLKDIAEAFLTKPAPGPEAHPKNNCLPGNATTIARQDHFSPADWRIASSLPERRCKLSD
jgi:hypothetical protein